MILDAPRRERAMPPMPLALLALLAVAAALFATGIHWGMPHWFGWTADELHPTSWGEALSPRTYDGWHTRYPPLHFAVLQGLSWPLRLGLDAAGVPKLERTVWLIYFSRVVSLLLALATVALMDRIGREVHGPRTGLFAAAILVCVAPYVYYAKMGNLDAPYIFWFAWSLLFFVRILKHHRARDYALFALMAAAAVCTKDQAYGLYGLAPLPILWSLARREHPGRNVLAGIGRSLVDRRFLLAAAAAAAGFVVLQMIPWNLVRFTRHVELLVGPMSDNYQDYQNTPEGHGQLLALFLRQIVFCLNPALAAVAAAGTAWTLWRGRRGAGSKAGSEPFLTGSLVFLVVSYYVTFLSQILFSFDRYILPVALLLAFPAARLLAELTAPGKRLLALRRTAVGALFAWSFLYAASVDARMLVDTRYGVEAYVRQHATRPGSAVAIGRRKHVPRFRFVDWERALRRNGRWLDRWLARERPEYLAINVSDLRREGEIRLYQRLARGEMGYRLVRLQRGEPLFNLLELEERGTSQRFINPEIALFERVDETPLSVSHSPAGNRP